MEAGPLKFSSVKGKRVIVTGGAGIIGRELLKRLGQQGASVFSVDRMPLPDGEWPGVTHLQQDLATAVLDELRGFQPQIIMHLAAAFERSEESPEFWETNWHDNTLLSHRIADMTMDMAGLETFVFASSYLNYAPSLYMMPEPTGDTAYLKESDTVSPRNVCGASKYYTERELKFIKDVYRPSLRTLSARIYRVYGCGSKDVISRWVRAALAGDTIEVYNRENRFDYIYAGDVAEGLLRLAESAEAEGPVNLGSGRARSVAEVLDILAKLLPESREKMKDLGSQAPFEASCADLAMLKRYCEWSPPTSLEDGIKTLTAYEQNRAGRGEG
jgi:nucleoside-diphosphate-sugar epimerase